MVEVFRTDVNDRIQANILIQEIQNTLSHCLANFDLEDCDRVLRVTGVTGEADIFSIMTITKKYGCHIEVLPDDYDAHIELSFEQEVLLSDGDQ